MKLGEVLKEQSNPYEAWLSDYVITATRASSQHAELTGSDVFDLKSGKVKAEISRIILVAKKNVVWSWPFDKAVPEWCGLTFGDWGDAGVHEMITFESFDDMPNAKSFIFRSVQSCNFKSIKGCEKLTNLISIAFDLEFSEIEGGLLRFLKMPALKNLHVTGYGGPRSKARNTSNALDIVNKHLNGDRKIPECQQELIEEGLQEFAKL